MKAKHKKGEKGKEKSFKPIPQEDLDDDLYGLFSTVFGRSIFTKFCEEMKKVPHASENIFKGPK